MRYLEDNFTNQNNGVIEPIIGLLIGIFFVFSGRYGMTLLGYR